VSQAGRRASRASPVWCGSWCGSWCEPPRLVATIYVVREALALYDQVRTSNARDGCIPKPCVAGSIPAGGTWFSCVLAGQALFSTTLRRPALALAARRQREHEWPSTSVVSEGHRPERLDQRPTRPDRRRDCSVQLLPSEGHRARSRGPRGRRCAPGRPIRVIHRESAGTCGVPRITAEPHDPGDHVNRKRVARVMRGVTPLQ
jgi:hypothetical protein